MTPARDGMRVGRDIPFAPLNTGTAGESTVDEPILAEPEILVIGGGPAGLMAAATAAEAGADVVLLDERPAVGGQYYKQPKVAHRLPARMLEQKQFRVGAELAKRAIAAGVTMHSNALVWGVFEQKTFACRTDDAARLFRPARTIVATGAYERAVACPGWTLPGVMTTGAAQTLLRSYGTLPGQRVLIGGNGPLNYQVALELHNAGADVVAVTDSSSGIGVTKILSALRMSIADAGLTAKGLRLRFGLAAAGIPVKMASAIAGIEAVDGGLCVHYGKAEANVVQADESVEVDAVCMGYGFLPNNELLRLVGCRHAYESARRSLITERNTHCETSIKGLYAIGDCCGLGGAHAAMEEARIAASHAAASLGKAPAKDTSTAAAKRLLRHRRFQNALWSLFDAPQHADELAEQDTFVCRCEGVTLAQLDNAIAVGHRSLKAIKQCTRLGMGVCQGRYCVSIAAARLRRTGEFDEDEYAFLAPRVPLKPISIADVAAMATVLVADDNAR
jgi:NADPH-dependent 2,4-dienoyl-CoA reductase/sulfur reductase-like enzyme